MDRYRNPLRLSLNRGGFAGQCNARFNIIGPGIAQNFLEATMVIAEIPEICLRENGPFISGVGGYHGFGRVNRHHRGRPGAVPRASPLQTRSARGTGIQGPAGPSPGVLAGGVLRALPPLKDRGGDGEGRLHRHQREHGSPHPSVPAIRWPGRVLRLRRGHRAPPFCGIRRVR